MKKIILISVAALTLVMMAATIVEKYQGTPYVSANIYGAWWFTLLWAVMATAGIIYSVKMRLYRRVPLMLLHGSFVIILAGALCTSITQKNGMVHLRQSMSVNTLTLNNGGIERLPFAMSLQSFHVVYYPGTDAPQDYVSDIIVRDNGTNSLIHISMNNIGEYNGYRFCQSGYDDDGKGTVLSIQYDPWGIGITYFGYLLLLIAVIWTLCSRHTRIRQLYHEAVTKPSKYVATVILFMVFTMSANAEPRCLPSDMADKFGHICILYDNRICPANTVATVFTTKLTGRSSWNGMSANEIFTGWTFYFDYWEDVRMIRIKDKVAQQTLGINGEWASFNDYWDQYNNYKLAEPIKKANVNGDHTMLRHLRDADEKFNLISMFYHGELLRMYPYPVKVKGGQTHVKWFTPGDEHLPLNIPEKEWFFLRKSLDYLSEAIVTGDNTRADILIGKINDYQHLRAASVMPSRSTINIEIVYNTINTLRWPIFLALTLSIAFVILLMAKKTRMVNIANDVFVAVMFVWITTLLALRWIISGHMPLANGYETMLFMAWAMTLLTVFMQRRILVIRMFGPLLAALCLLVAMLSGADPQVSQLMPVLQSPLLSVHVVVIMFSYALLAMTCMISLTAISMTALSKNANEKVNASVKSYTALSQLLLYPAVMCLTIGIFIGAVWANISWGRYWSWDSKETWALITMLIYALPLHTTLFPQHRTITIHGRQYLVYNIYIVLAFLTVLMTYFGVNYFLTGMHSYA